MKIIAGLSALLVTTLLCLPDNGFNFKLYGGQPDDPGLDFKK